MKMLKKILTMAIVMVLLVPSLEAQNKKDKHKPKKEKHHPRKEKRKHKQIPIDGGLTAFAVAAAAAGITILRKREVES